jgi:hypothetical protein
MCRASNFLYLLFSRSSTRLQMMQKFSYPSSVRGFLTMSPIGRMMLHRRHNFSAGGFFLGCTLRFAPTAGDGGVDVSFGKGFSVRVLAKSFDAVSIFGGSIGGADG